MAAEFLERKNAKILFMNYTTKYGEVDIIYIHEGYLVFGEVKYRKDSSKGNPAEAVSYIKQRKITSSALYFLSKNKYLENTPIRFDIISILGSKISIIKSAFEPIIYG